MKGLLTLALPGDGFSKCILSKAHKKALKRSISSEIDFGNRSEPILTPPFSTRK